MYVYISVRTKLRVACVVVAINVEWRIWRTGERHSESKMASNSVESKIFVLSMLQTWLSSKALPFPERKILFGSGHVAPRLGAILVITVPLSDSSRSVTWHQLSRLGKTPSLVASGFMLPSTSSSISSWFGAMIISWKMFKSSSSWVTNFLLCKVNTSY